MNPDLKKILDESSSVVFFGGAGVSTESGIPDFRSESGLYHAQQVYGYAPETMLSSDFYYRHPELFFRYYKENLIHTEAEPNAAHRALARLEKEGKLTAVVTQNIDGLHQKAGSEKVYELHGSVLRNYCEKCGKFCGGRIKPDVVLYGEMLNEDVISGAVNAISRADTLIIGGTSLAVYPAAGLINYFGGRHLVLINKTKTPYDDRADLVIYDSIGKVMGD